MNMITENHEETAGGESTGSSRTQSRSSLRYYQRDWNAETMRLKKKMNKAVDLHQW